MSGISSRKAAIETIPVAITNAKYPGKSSAAAVMISPVCLSLSVSLSVFKSISVVVKTVQIRLSKIRSAPFVAFFTFQLHADPLCAFGLVQDPGADRERG